MGKPVALLSNVSFVNRGDALMAESIRRRIADSHSIAFPFHATVRSRPQVEQFYTHMYSDIPNWSWKRTVLNTGIASVDELASWLPRAARRGIGVVVDRDIEVVFDVSGYCFGDHWGLERMRRTIQGYRKWARSGKPIILMPKTWGPFQTIPSALLKELFSYITIAFARDITSYKCVAAKLDSWETSKLHFAPDYTHEVELPVGDREGPFYIIPSYRMVDSGTVSKPEYLEFLSTVKRTLASGGHRVAILLHEASNDLWFLKQAEKIGFRRDDVLFPRTPLEAKRAISQSQGVVTSRLHGLYNSLNTATPVLAAAWSFKYDEALKQYGCEDCLLDRNNLSASFLSKVRYLTRPEVRADLIVRLLKSKPHQREMTNDMWQRIGRAVGRPL